MPRSLLLIFAFLAGLRPAEGTGFPTLRGTDLATGAYDRKTAHTNFFISGKVLDAFPDDIDRRFAFMTFDTDGEIYYAAVRLEDKPFTLLHRIVGARVSLLASAEIIKTYSRRRLTGRLLVVDKPDYITVLEPPPADLFDAPPFGDMTTIRPHELQRLGKRKISGYVTAVWDTSSFLLQTETNTTVRVETADGCVPVFGAHVEVVGLPETDVFRLNLNRAIWRKLDGSTRPMPPPQDTSAREIFLGTDENHLFQYELHGAVVRITGVVHSLPIADSAQRKIVIRDGDYFIPVDVSANPSASANVTPGCTVSVTGTCVMDVENWRPNATFPRVKGFFLVLRTADDLTVLARPPWWTTGRLLTVIGILGILVLGSFLWGLLLRRTAERRGRELAEERIAHAESEIRTMERTRLAVELHDSLAQNLTGVSMEIQSAALCAESDPQESREHVRLADLALKNCQGELRNSLWDLRNDALEESNVETAIRRTILPHIRGVNVRIRFNVSRTFFTDNTLHELLRVIRELVINGIRHGRAAEIQIAGAVEGRTLLISVRDNGQGFDVSRAPGVSDGHFGLQGIRERLRKLSGSLRIESQAGEGTRATVAIRLPQIVCTSEGST